MQVVTITTTLSYITEISEKLIPIKPNQTSNLILKTKQYLQNINKNKISSLKLVTFY